MDLKGMRANTEKRKVMMCQVSRCQAGNLKKKSM